VSGLKLFWLRFPIGRARRLETALRQRSTLLAAKNDVMDLIFQTQAPLARLGIQNEADVRAAMQDPDKRRLLGAYGLNREMVEAELRERYGSETTGALDAALQELVAEGVILRVPGRLLLATSDIFLAIHARRRPLYDVGLLNRLLHEGRDEEKALRSRDKRDDSTETGRTYRL
jgi:hypothetical protein